MYKVISETKQEFNGEVFYKCGEYFQHKGKRLHRTVWSYFFGEIPEGYHIHHINGNKSDNRVENLEIRLESDHLSYHSSLPEAREHQMYAIKCAQEKARLWHKTPEARALHSQWAKEGAKKVKPVSLVCQHCGKSFESKNRNAKFCSGSCKTASRNASGVDNEIRECPSCGKKYEVNKYSRGKCCSKKCSWKIRKSQEGNKAP